MGMREGTEGVGTLRWFQVGSNVPLDMTILFYFDNLGIQVLHD